MTKICISRPTSACSPSNDDGFAASKAAGHTNSGTTKRYYLDVKGKVAPSVRHYGDVQEQIDASNAR